MDWRNFRLGDYEIIGKIRYGPWAEILQGRSLANPDGLTVAIKRPTPPVAEVPENLQAFLREAHLLESLSHPAFPKVIEVSKTPPFLVMEQLHGATLSTLESVAVDSSKGLKSPHIVLLLIDWLDGLDHLHSAVSQPTLAHSDLTRGNLYADSQGRGRLLDLGMATLPESFRRESLKRRFPHWSSFPENTEQECKADVAALLEAAVPHLTASEESRHLAQTLSMARTGQWYGIPSAASLRKAIMAERQESKRNELKQLVVTAQSSSRSS